MKDSLAFLVQQLLVKNQIKFDKKELEFQIQSHPSYPSLHAITGVLSHFNIENIALTVPVNELILAELPKHFLAQIILADGSGELVLVSNDRLYYEIQFDDKQRSRYSIDEFIDKFTGVMVAVEKEPIAKGIIKTDRDSVIKKSLFWVSFILFLTLWMVSKPNWFISLFLLASLIGLYVSITIFRQEQGEETSLGEAFCSGESKKSDCDFVIQSTGAKLFGMFKLSDLSLLYFAGLSLLTYVLGIFNLGHSIPYAFGIIAVLITLYSLYYQAFVAKAWCGLCLSIVGILWGQAAIAMLNYKVVGTFLFSVKEVLITLSIFIFVAVVWTYLKSILVNVKELREEKIKYYRFKNNFSIFSKLLQSSGRIDTAIPNVVEIVLGENNDGLPITIITNPFCGHCKPVHALVEDIYHKFSEITTITIRFNINVKNKEGDAVNISARLLELYHTRGVNCCLKAMHDIYGRKSVSSWLQEWGSCQEKEKYIEILEKENDWCRQKKINFTPEILIAGKSFPKEYDRGDLIYFIEDLQEEYVRLNKNVINNLEKMA